MKSAEDFDEIGYWSEIKLAILKEYAKAYSTIMTAQSAPRLRHSYIDAFAGAGIHFSRQTSDFVKGSPLNALLIKPPFAEFHLIDLAANRVESLEKQIAKRDDVHIYHGDCNKVLLEEVFPKVQFSDYRRGLCILDPYGLHLDWEVIRTAGQMRSLDIFLNFPVLDMNRNVLWHDPARVQEKQRTRMNRFWGDDSWRTIAYRTDTTLFGTPEKQSSEIIVDAFRQRLKKVAGFPRVPAPLPMRNKKGAVVYYLFFASQKNTAENIVLDIFNKYEGWGTV